MKLTLGRVVITPGALDALNGEDVLLSLARHQQGDWGDVWEEDWNQNDYAVGQLLRILSSYRDRNGCKFWVAHLGSPRNAVGGPTSAAPRLAC